LVPGCRRRKPRTSPPPLLLRQRYLKPKYARQLFVKRAVYARAKAARDGLVRKMLLDPDITPF
jgi:hypothetical protein